MGYEIFQIFAFFFRISLYLHFFHFQKSQYSRAAQKARNFPTKKHQVRNLNILFFPLRATLFTALTAFDDSDGTVLDYGEPLARGDS
jgi:hypothetical protein